ncbi:MAG TPA: SRPBCC family protein [Acidimicrobiia bacterium]|nr:SRPBCC family protein [Acidimicrobiia bacterium]
MRFEQSIDIDAPPERVWEVISDVEAWPRLIETVDTVEILTPPPVGKGTRVLLKQPKLPEGNWEITAWDPPSYFEWLQKSGGITNVAGHRIEPSDAGGSRLTLTIEMRGFLIPVMALFFKRLIEDYMSLEAQGIKSAVESGG